MAFSHHDNHNTVQAISSCSLSYSRVEIRFFCALASEPMFVRKVSHIIIMCNVISANVATEALINQNFYLVKLLLKKSIACYIMKRFLLDKSLQKFRFLLLSLPRFVAFSVTT